MRTGGFVSQYEDNTLPLDQVDVRTLHSLSKDEACERFGWDEATYARAMRATEAAAAVLENRSSQGTVALTHAITLGKTRDGRVRVDKQRAGGADLVVIRETAFGRAVKLLR